MPLNETARLRQENAALRDRLSRLSAASLRINESLDFDTVLQEVLDSARSLTGARHGIITTLGEAGQAEDIVTSGLTPEERAGLWVFPDALKIFESLSQIEGPLRVCNLGDHISSLGVPEFLPPVAVNSFLGTPMRHQGVRVGTCYLAEKGDGPEFTLEDEETLVMFASQAALVVSNVRKYREEQQARADLEALVNTSPVGVVVFDARTGKLVLFNREATRIVGGLQVPDHTPEQLLELTTVKRADGREVSLSELPLEQTLGSGETVPAEEMVFSIVPDGRPVSALVNATPIRSEDGEIVSLVVTLQDMTELQELEQLRAEFLGMVSHELRTPLTSIRGSATTVLDDVSAFAPGEVRQFLRIIVEQADRMRGLISDLLDVAHIETGSLSVDPEPADVASLVDEARKTFLSGGGREGLSIDIAPDLPLVMADARRIVQVLGNLFSNAARHSEEPFPIRVTAVQRDIHVAFSVADEGKGIKAERLPHLFRKFARLAGEERERDLDGVGLGLAICKGIVEAHGGRIWAESDGQGLGARFTFIIPVAEEEDPETETSPGQPLARSPRAPGELTRILVVDDEPQALRHVRDALSIAGYAPIVTGDPEEALRIMEEYAPQLVLLDLMLPGSDGIELMEAILETADVPVIFLSAYGQQEIVAKAFDKGAVDYVVKPFAPTELAARIRSALRRRTDTSRPERPERFVLGEMTIDYAEREVTVAGRPVPLTTTEYRLLAELVTAGGRVLTYRQLLWRVWKVGDDGDVRPVRTIVKSLRQKLGDDARSPTYIFNKPRVGYRLATQEQPDETAD